MSIPVPQGGDADRFLRVLSLNVWYAAVNADLAGADLSRGLAFVSKDRPPRIAAIAAYLASSDYDIVCLQELWIYKDYEIVKQEVQKVLPFSRFFHTFVRRFAGFPELTGAGARLAPAWLSSPVSLSYQPKLYRMRSRARLQRSSPATSSSTKQLATWSSFIHF